MQNGMWCRVASALAILTKRHFAPPAQYNPVYRDLSYVLGTMLQGNLAARPAALIFPQLLLNGVLGQVGVVRTCPVSGLIKS